MLVATSRRDDDARSGWAFTEIRRCCHDDVAEQCQLRLIMKSTMFMLASSHKTRPRS